MFDALTPSTIVAHIKMTRTAFKGAILLVEGSDDSRFFRKFIDKTACYLFPARGKSNVLGAMGLLENSDIHGVLAVVDADFLRILSRDDLPANVLMTDFHDLEVVMLESKALDYVLEEFGSSEKIQLFLRSVQVNSIRDALYEAAWPFGILRLISQEKDLSLTFDGIKYKKIVNKETLRADCTKMIQSVRQLSVCTLPSAEIQRLHSLASAERADADRRQVCCGHDVIEIFSVGLRSAIGNLNHRTADARYLAAGLRLSFDHYCLKGTVLYTSIKEWEGENGPFVIIPD